jgi:hypothetical protein
MTDQSQQTQTDSAAPWFADDQKDYVTTKGWKSPADAITSAQNLEKLVGMDRAGRAIYKPKDDNDAEGIKAFRSALGVPEKPDDYKLPVSQEDGGAFSKALSAMLHAEGVPAASGAKLADGLNKYIEAAVAADEQKFAAESQKQLDALKGEWGDKFTGNSEQARRGLKAVGMADDQVASIEKAIGTASMLKMMHAFGSKIGEAGPVDGERPAGFGGDKPAIQRQIDELRAKRQANQIGEKDYLAQIEGLHKQLAA